MRRKLKNLKNKNGHSENGSPRALIDLAFYREFQSFIHDPASGGLPVGFDTGYSGFTNASRPRDSAITLRRHRGIWH